MERMSNKKDVVIVGTVIKVIKVNPKDLTLGACLLNYLNNKVKKSKLRKTQDKLVYNLTIETQKDKQ